MTNPPISDSDYILEGNKFLSQNDYSRAAIAYLDAIKINPNNEMAYCNLANVYLDLGHIKEAIQNYRRAITLKPNYTSALCNLGAAYGRAGELKKALVCYQKVIQIDPNHQTVYIFLGNILLAQGSLEEAETCYKMAIEKDKNSSQAYNNLGSAYAKQQRYQEAIDAYKHAMKLDRTFRVPLSNIATAYVAADKPQKALEYYTKAYLLEPANSSVVANYYHQLKAAADWEKMHRIEKVLNKLTQKELALKRKTGEEPFINVTRSDNKEQNYQLASLWSRAVMENITHRRMFKYSPILGSPRRLKIGYFSSHFHDHPTGHLISQLFSVHDRDKYEIYLYSSCPDDNSTYYRTIKSGADKFIDLTYTNFSDSAVIINEDQIDILIDLDGYTDNHKMEVMALKPAPIQVTYLGFPGTTGSAFIDYLVTDKVTTPPSYRKYFSEKLIFLPPTYQVNNSLQAEAKSKYQRKTFSLPEKGFVFCCFNGTYKIEPRVFDVWMEILKKVPGSVLWLLKTNPTAQTNLQNEARKRGIDPKRLVFSKRMPKDKHLKRLSLADLALDTLICNGHTTTSDTLWAGVPLVTLQGKHFASRVASSILTAAGLPDLITNTIEEYQNLAVKLALNPQELKKIKDKLVKNRSTSSVFNTAIFCRRLEKAFEQIWDLYQKGESPKDIIIND